jgi:hypothetical protein
VPGFFDVTYLSFRLPFFMSSPTLLHAFMFWIHVATGRKGVEGGGGGGGDCEIPGITSVCDVQCSRASMRWSFSLLQRRWRYITSRGNTSTRLECLLTQRAPPCDTCHRSSGFGSSRHFLDKSQLASLWSRSRKTTCRISGPSTTCRQWMKQKYGWRCVLIRCCQSAMKQDVNAECCVSNAIAPSGRGAGRGGEIPCRLGFLG